MDNNEEKRAFAKNGENKIKFFNERPPREDIWKFQPRSTLSYRDEELWEEVGTFQEIGQVEK